MRAREQSRNIAASKTEQRRLCERKKGRQLEATVEDRRESEAFYIDRTMGRDK
jgi:hypothetical protein